MKKYKTYLVFLIFIMSPLALIVILKQLPEPKPPTQGIPNNYWVPTSKEDTDWTGTTQGEDTTYSDEYVMWITGEGDTIWE